MSRMIKVYNARTGEVVDSFSAPTKQQLKDGHPSMNLCIRRLNAGGYCVKSQLADYKKQFAQDKLLHRSPIAKAIDKVVGGR